ncbi:MAG TPA: hypothetical protein VNQ97_09785 [Burkholderiaceae bacterium]|nr:hypothetical protein [Burkholderiaceae bacterium]
MDSKFDAVPLDDETFILAQNEIVVGGYDALHQVWKWEGIRAESLIFLTADVAALQEEDLKQLLVSEAQAAPGSAITVSHSDSGYTFLNFNFQEPD